MESQEVFIAQLNSGQYWQFEWGSETETNTGYIMRVEEGWKKAKSLL